MLDPFTYWTRILSSLRTMEATGTRMGETADAARAVIAARTDTIGEAMASPFTGDYAELSRMVPEKLAAFGLSGEVVMRATRDAQQAYMAEVQYLSTMMMRGRPLTPIDLATAWSRASLAAVKALEANARLGRDALAPVHKTVTANAKRLRKGKPRAG